jgi:hypothetical protein
MSISATHWRLFSEVINGDTYTGVDDIEFHTEIGGAQAAVGGTVIASGVDGAYAAANAFDGDSATHWQVGVDHDQWIGYIFPSAVKVVEVVVHGSIYQNQTPKCWRLEYSTDGGTTWQVAFYVTGGSAGYASHEVRTFQWPIGLTRSTARYWALWGYGTEWPDVGILEFRTTVSGATATGSGTASASDNNGATNVPANAFDGNTATRWQGDSSNYHSTHHYLAYDFGSAQYVAECAVVATSNEPGRGFAYGAAFYSSDGAVWLLGSALQTFVAWTTGGQTQAFVTSDGETGAVGGRRRRFGIFAGG